MPGLSCRRDRCGSNFAFQSAQLFSLFSLLLLSAGLLEATLRRLLLKGCVGNILEHELFGIVDVTHPDDWVFVLRRELITAMDACGHNRRVRSSLRTLLQALILVEPITWLLDRLVLP